MSIDYRSDIRRAIFTLLLIVPLTGMMSCGKKGAAPAAGAEEATLTEESDVASDASSWDPNATLGVEERKTLFTDIPAFELTGWDKITKCELEGRCTHEDAVKWKILYFFDHPALNPDFKREEEETEPCGSPQFEEIMHEIEQSPTLLDFYDAIREEVSPNNTTPTQSKGGMPPLVKAGNIVPGSDIEQITTLNGLTFTVLRSDPNRDQYRLLDQRRSINAPGGRVIDVYFQSGDESAAGSVEDCIADSRTWRLLEDEFGAGITPLSLEGQPHPTIFIVKKLFNAAGQYFFRRDKDKKEGYVALMTSYGFFPVQFLRGHHDVSQTEAYKGLCAHELHHFVARSYFRAERFLHSFTEGHATWFANQLYRGSSSGYYRTVLYQPHIPIDHSEPGNHEYSASILWAYLSCRASDVSEPVRLFNECIADGEDDFSCTNSVLERYGGSSAEALLSFAETMLNVPIEGVPRMRDCDPAYKDYYHLGAFGYVMTLPGESQDPRMEFSTSQERFSIKAYVLVTPFGDAKQNYLKMDLSAVCRQDGMACSVIGFRVDKEDRSRFSFLFRERVTGGTGIVERRATQPDGEPDVLVILVANGNISSAQPVKGAIRVDAKPFSQPGDFLLERRRVIGPDALGNSSRVVVTYEGKIDLPDINRFPVRNQFTPDGVTIPFVVTSFAPNLLPSPLNQNGSQLLGSGFGTLADAELRWEFETVNVEGACPWNVIKTTRTGSGVIPLDLYAGDYLDFFTVTPSSDGSEGIRYILYPHYHGGNPVVELNWDETCEPCCPDPPATLLHDIVPWPLQLPAVVAEGSFESGATSFPLSRPNSTDTWGTLSLSEPLEWKWQGEEEELYYMGGIVGDLGTGVMMYQLRPPIIDFPSSVQPACLSQPDILSVRPWCKQ